MKIIFQILWVLSICFSASQSQEKNNGFNQRRQLHSSGRDLARSQSAKAKPLPNSNPPRSILPQYHQNLASQSLSRSTNSKLLPPKKQLPLKSSIPKKLAKLQTHSNKASQPKLGPTENSSKTQSRSRQSQVYQNNSIQKRPHFKSTIHNRPHSLHPGQLRYSKKQPQKSQSPPNPSVKKVIKPFKSLSNTALQQKPQLPKHNPNSHTLQKASLNKPQPNKFVKRRTRQRKPNSKALVQNIPSHTKTHLEAPGGRKRIQPLNPRKCLQPSSQGRRPQSSNRRQHPHPLGQKIPNPLIKVPRQIKATHCIRPHIQNKPESHHYHPHVHLSPDNPYPSPFIPSLKPQVQPTSKVVSTRTQVLNTTPFAAIATTTPHYTISSNTTSATTTNKISSDLIFKSTTPSDITVSSPKTQVPVTIPLTAATTSNAPTTEISPPLVTATTLPATMQTTPFTIHTILKMTTESGYETTELPYSSTNPDNNYIYETTESYYYDEFDVSNSEITASTYTTPKPASTTN